MKIKKIISMSLLWVVFLCAVSACGEVPEQTIDSDVIEDNTESIVSMVRCPNFVGQSYTDILNNKLYTDEYAFVFAKVEKYDPEVEKGIVIDQSKNVGERLEEGTSIELTVSKGPEGVRVPDVTGKDIATATNELENAGFKVDTQYVYEPHPTIAENLVIKTTPYQTSYELPGETIILHISTGN